MLLYTWNPPHTKVYLEAFAYMEFLVCTLSFDQDFDPKYAMGNPRTTGFDVS